jgi:hypothetical protein
MKIRSTRLNLLAAAALVVLACAAAPQASAFTWEYDYAGESCVNRSPSITPYYFYGAIGNPSQTDWMYLDCPLPRSSGFTSGGVNVIDQNAYTGFDVTCTEVGVHWNSTSISYYTAGTRNSSGAGTQQQYLNFSSSSVGAFPTVYYYSCAIPPTYGANASRSYIETYNDAEAN